MSPLFRALPGPALETVAREARRIEARRGRSRGAGRRSRHRVLRRGERTPRREPGRRGAARGGARRRFRRGRAHARRAAHRDDPCVNAVGVARGRARSVPDRGYGPRVDARVAPRRSRPNTSSNQRRGGVVVRACPHPRTRILRPPARSLPLSPLDLESLARHRAGINDRGAGRHRRWSARVGEAGELARDRP